MGGVDVLAGVVAAATTDRFGESAKPNARINTMIGSRILFIEFFPFLVSAIEGA
jgi:hypothetical protein